MKKIIILFVGVVFIFTLISCSKTVKEPLPFFNLMHDERTDTTLLVNYNENGTHSSKTG